MPQKLGLDEALVTVNKSLIKELVNVYTQLEECYACPLEKFVSLDGNLPNFVINTKHKHKLELRTNSSLLCQVDSLDLNSHGHYKIELAHPVGSHIECNIEELDSGDCLLCPVALLICLVIMVNLGEKLYSRLISCREGVDKLESANSFEDEQHTNETRASDSTLSREIISHQTDKSERLLVLDAFRGLTIMGMIMVNYGGAGYAALDHMPWDGISLADFVFPFFIFATGISVAFSSKVALKREAKLKYCLYTVLQRSFKLFFIGICLNSTKLGVNGKLDDLRLTGVLQRIAISYLIVASTYIVEIKVTQHLSRTSSTYRSTLLQRLLGASIELLLALIMLAVYLFVTFQLEYSDTCPAGYVGPGGMTDEGRYAACTGGAAAWLDRLVLGDSHLYQDDELKQIFKTQVTHDPEGILGFTTSILLAMFGLQCGKILSQFKQDRSRLVQMVGCSGILSLCCIVVLKIPINKKLWSLTFVTVTGSSAFATIALLYLITDVYKWQDIFLIRLLVSAGRNSIFLYVAHSLVHYMLPWYFSVDETSHLQLLLLLTWSTFLWLLVAHYMASKKIFVSV